MILWQLFNDTLEFPYKGYNGFLVLGLIVGEKQVSLYVCMVLCTTETVHFKSAPMTGYADNE